MSKTTTTPQNTTVGVLVRDKIPHMITKNGRKCDSHRETDQTKIEQYYREALLATAMKYVETCSKENVNKNTSIHHLIEVASIVEALVGFEDMYVLEKANAKKVGSKGHYSNVILDKVYEAPQGDSNE